jgi:hypothetical protein
MSGALSHRTLTARRSCDVPEVSVAVGALGAEDPLRARSLGADELAAQPWNAASGAPLTGAHDTRLVPSSTARSAGHIRQCSQLMESGQDHQVVPARRAEDQA